ncbi:hypothetical protein ACFVUW_10800 [Streptomyces xiamenensis]|uniref:hypothetical protein n=1 Tax=Streptomyces xiamenensis TaxID=408015 RepID=UPI0036EB35E2
MDSSDFVGRIQTLNIGGPPARPEWVTDDVYEVRVVGVITECRPHPYANVEPLYSDFNPTPFVTTVRCPTCTAEDGMVIRGRWGDPAVITCPHGHQWEPEDQVWSTTVLQQALLATA